MSRTLFTLAATAALSVVLAGCASGPKYAEMAGGISTVKPGEGRIFFFRSTNMFGGAIQPDVQLDGQVVGKSQPGGFFYVDRPAGNHVAATTTEVEKTASFALDAGETKYLRTSASFGVVAARIVVELETPEKAQAEISSLSYTGGQAAKAK